MKDLESGLVALIERIVDERVRLALAEHTAPIEYLSTSQAAELAGVAAGTVRRWIREGRLPEHRAGRHVRVRRADLESLMASGRRKKADLTPEARALRDFGVD